MAVVDGGIGLAIAVNVCRRNSRLPVGACRRRRRSRRSHVGLAITVNVSFGNSRVGSGRRSGDAVCLAVSIQIGGRDAGLAAAAALGVRDMPIILRRLFPVLPIINSRGLAGSLG